MDYEQFRIDGKKMIDYIADYHKNIGQKPVVPNVEPGFLSKLLESDAPCLPIGFDELMKEVEEFISKGMTHWHHPMFFAFYPTGFSFPSMLGSMLADCYACIGLNWMASPSCTELELIVLDWLVKAMNLPKSFLSNSGCGGGSILNSASDCSLMVLLVERNAYIEKAKKSGSLESQGELVDKMRIYFTSQAHNSVERACKLALINYCWIKTDEDESMDSEDLERQIKEDLDSGLIPLMVMTSMGSTSICAFDKLNKVGQVCHNMSVKCHVDAAYAGSGLICPEFRHWANGIEKINSFCFNAHKLLGTHFSCSVLWTDDRHLALQAFNVDATYLSHDFENIVTDLRHWQIPLGRKFNALKLWFVLKMFGIEGLQAKIRHHVKLAKILEDKVNTSDKFELIRQVKFGLVCFRIKYNSGKTRILYDRIKERGNIFLSTSEISTDIEKNQYFLRICCSVSCQEEDVIEAFDLIDNLADQLN